MEENTILDEVAEFFDLHLHASETQVTAMVLYAAATWGLPAFVTFGRMLFASEQPESGKTLAMQVTAMHSANPEDISGTSHALQSALAAASNKPEMPAPTLFYDEISDVFGRSGLNASRNPIAEILRKGYKKGATRSWSVNRVNEKYSIFSPFLMTGLRVAIPADIRSRSIVITMEPGRPQEYFDVRESEPLARRYGHDLGVAVRQVMDQLAEFRARDVNVPGLHGRKAEVWEPLFAVAIALGGQKWLNRCAAAFSELSASSGTQVMLTVRQQVFRDVTELMSGPLADMADEGFLPGITIADELKRLDDELYQMSDNGLRQLVARMMGETVRKRQESGLLRRGYPYDRMMGYYASDILAEWDRIRPAEAGDVETSEAEDPFAVPEPARGARGARGSAEPVMSLINPPCEDDEVQAGSVKRRNGSVEDRFKIETLKEK